MFSSFESFTVVFFTLLAIAVLLIVFEDKLIALEDKYLGKKTPKRTSARVSNKKAVTAGTNRHTATKKVQRSPMSGKRTNRNYAA